MAEAIKKWEHIYVLAYKIMQRTRNINASFKTVIEVHYANMFKSLAHCRTKLTTLPVMLEIHV